MAEQQPRPRRSTRRRPKLFRPVHMYRLALLTVVFVGILLLCLSSSQTEKRDNSQIDIAQQRVITLHAKQPNSATDDKIDYPGFNKGEWIFHKNTNRPLAPCCMNEPTYFHEVHWNKSQCNNGDLIIEEGDWRMPGGVAHWCHCKNNNKKTGLPNKPKVQGEWIWTPTLPEKRKPLWEAKLFCKLLDGRNMYFLGDSTTRQTRTAVQSLVQMGKGDCANQLRLWKSDMLVPFPLDHVSHAERDHAVPFYMEALLSPTSQEEAIVIINVGAHVNHDKDYNRTVQWLANYLDDHKGVIDQQTITHKKKGRIKVYWKTNNPMHQTCNKHPSQPTTNAKALSAKGEFNTGTKYEHHNSVKKRDRWAVQTVYPFVTGVVDMTPLYLRPDGHTRDCFHFCWDQYTGSPIEYFGTAMLDALLHPDKRVV